MIDCSNSRNSSVPAGQGSVSKTIVLRRLLFFGSLCFISIACSVFSSPEPTRVTPVSPSRVPTTADPDRSTSIPALTPPGVESTQIPSAYTPEAATQSYSETFPAALNSATPGLLVRGKVTGADGHGLEGVSICRRFASYPGATIATTDPNGTFSADFSIIPGDEMVAVWPELAGFRFEPPMVYWRHYYGFEETTLDFTASRGESSSSSCR